MNETGKAAPQHTYGGAGGKRLYSFYSFTTSSLYGVGGQRHALATLYHQGKDPGSHCTGGWVGPRAGLKAEARGRTLLLLLGIEPRSPGRPVRSQTLY
jgi:hypothetical protein